MEGTGCPPWRLNYPKCETYAEHLGQSFVYYHIVYACVVISAAIFVLYHAYRTIKIKSFAPLKSIQVRLHLLIIVGVSLLVFRISNPLGYTSWVPYQLAVITYDLNGVITICIGLDIITDWIRVVNIARGKLLLSSKLRYWTLALQCATFCVLMVASFLQAFADPWWLFHCVKLSGYVLISFTICLAFYFYGLRVRNIILEAERILKHNKAAKYIAPQLHSTQQQQGEQQGQDTNQNDSYQTKQITMQNNNNKNINDQQQNHKNGSPEDNPFHFPSSITQSYLIPNSKQQQQNPQQDESMWDDDNNNNNNVNQLNPHNNTLHIQHTITHEYNDPNAYNFENTSLSSTTNSTGSGGVDIEYQPLKTQTHHTTPQTTTITSHINGPVEKPRHSAATKVPRLIVLIIVSLIICIFAWSFVVYNEVQRKCTSTNSCNLLTHGVFSMLTASVFDVVHTGAYIAIVLFFSIKVPAKQLNDQPPVVHREIRSARHGAYVAFEDEQSSITQPPTTTTQLHTEDHNNTNNRSIVQPGTSHQTTHPVGSTTYTVRSLFPNSALNTRKLGSSYLSNNNMNNNNTIANSQLSASQLQQHNARNTAAAPSINPSHKQHVGVYSPDQIIDFQIGGGDGQSSVHGSSAALTNAAGGGGGGGNIPTSACIVDSPEVTAQVNDLFNQLLAKKTTSPSYRQQQQQQNDDNNHGLNISGTGSSHRNSSQVQRTSNSFKTNNPFTNSNSSNNNTMGDEITPSSSYMELTQYTDNNNNNITNAQQQQQQQQQQSNNNNTSGLGQMLRQHTSVPEQSHPQFIKSTDVRR